MISTETLTSAWIDKVAKDYGYKDKPLLEKAIRALYLLESLAKEGCPKDSLITEVLKSQIC